MEYRVKDEGMGLGVKFDKTQKECEDICDVTDQCKSFSYEPDKNKCYLFDRELTGMEQQIQWYNIYTVYMSCGKYVHKTLHKYNYS